MLSPHVQFQLLTKALKAVSEGQVWIDDEPVKALLNDTGAMSRSGKISGTTDRERRIIEYIYQGLTNKEIARRLTFSPHTVKTHLNNIFRKFNVTSRTKLMSLDMSSRRATLFDRLRGSSCLFTVGGPHTSRRWIIDLS